MVQQTPLECGICGAGPEQTDQLVHLGKMGYICLPCLDHVASAALPWAALLPRHQPSPVTPKGGQVVPFPLSAVGVPAPLAP